MFSLITPKIALGIGGALAIAGVMYVVNDYINLKSAYRVAQKTIEVQEHRRQVTDRSQIIVEKKQNENFSRQHKALLEMDKKGFISSNDGSNPKWLRASSETNS